MKKLLVQLGTLIVAAGMVGGGALVMWNIFGQGPYGDRCSYALGCRSFYCLSHEMAGSAQVSSAGTCTKRCEADAECGAGAVCVVLGDNARDDLPPFGKPTRACMKVREAPADQRR